MLTPPGFWAAGRNHPAALALAPLGALYALAGARRIAKTTPIPLSVPVICAGNATMGGVGKTPFVLALGERLKRRGFVPHVLIRGYGGRIKGPHRVGRADTAASVGDEATLLRDALPVWVGANRVATGREAIEAGASVLLLDDGFQNPGLAKTLSFLLVDAENRFGNGRVFPAGPLRERPEAALERADAVVAVTAGPDAALPDTLRAFAANRPLLRAWQRLDAAALPRDLPLFAFAGIGRPERFFRAVEASGGQLVGTKAFPDHHPYAARELEALTRAATERGATLVTTAKDFVRLPVSFRTSVRPLPSVMHVEDEDALDALLFGALGTPP
ncbi:tetraacyldisaccharide 4'-kinase [Parvularcula dongshanensis]|uniref:Tetraacyldisaccharide 4'-kinase n=1 Tax=Parvularcula dongshanensis TaxID=1173995 RepID=A0A840I814_9PROT|nr:tetraacyldisaccharide 4'-kinase [Parvularcula dongshanensis]MBB4660100.1 tetraacyldisaccharide 4'-kinase [Parvularcula dongshanensis]